MKKTLTIVMLLASSQAAIAADSIVLGTDLSQKTIVGIQSPCVRDGELLCNGVWVRWEIRVSKTLNGPAITGRIKAAMVQHGRFLSSRKLFVLKPISDPEFRKALGADYLLDEFSSPHEMFCLNSKPDGLEDATIHISEAKGDSSYCFELPDNDQ